jgi:hypothetical protein
MVTLNVAKLHSMKSYLLPADPVRTQELKRVMRIIIRGRKDGKEVLLSYSQTFYLILA